MNPKIIEQNEQIFPPTPPPIWKEGGEWGVGSGERGVGSGERGVGSGEWGVGSKRRIKPTVKYQHQSLFGMTV